MSNELIGNLAMGLSILVSLIAINFIKKARVLDSEIKANGETEEKSINLKKYKTIIIFLIPIDIVLLSLYTILA